MRFIVLLLLSVALMYVDHREQYLLPLRETLSASVAPLQYIVDWPVTFGKKVTSNFYSHQRLMSENADLHSKLLLVQARIQSQLALKQENDRLRALLKTSPKVGGDVLVAEILSIAQTPFTRQILLNRGRKAGVTIGQPVLDAYGVVGQVIQVNPLTSRVLMITDSRSAVPVQNTRNGVRAIAVGMGKQNDLQLLHVPATMDIKQGDIMVTSGLGERFTQGYPVGTVSSIKRSPGKAFVTVMLKPAAHLDRSRLVLLVWPPKVASHAAINNFLLVKARPFSFGEPEAKTS